jgi:transmembrane sensor
MLNNSYDKVEDFLLDDSFVEWVLGQSKDLDSYWENFIANNPEKSNNLNQARSIILSVKIKPTKTLSSFEISNMISNVQNKHQFNIADNEVPLDKSKWQLPLVMLRYAAVIATVFFVGWYSYSVYTHKNSQNTISQTALATTDEQRVINETSRPMLVKLPDNSSVILKPYAQIRYPVAFTNTKREVYLTGEAFFEVTKNAHKPFFVYSNELTVRVVGTSFSVKAYKGDKKFKVVVSTGKVLVTANQGGANPSILLKPNQQVVLNRKETKFEQLDLKTPAPLSKESTQIHFNFVDAPFSKVVATIEGAYGVKIIYNAKVMGNCPLTASLVDQTLEERLRLICKAVEAEYKIADGTITIDGKGCNN